MVELCQVGDGLSARGEGVPGHLWLQAVEGVMFEGGLRLWAWLEKGGLPFQGERAGRSVPLEGWGEGSRPESQRTSNVSLDLACGCRQGGHCSVGRDAENLVSEGGGGGQERRGQSPEKLEGWH